MPRLLTLAATLCLAAPIAAQTPPPEVVMKEALVVRQVIRSGRSAYHTDAVESVIVAGNWKTPHPGDTLAVPGGQRTWESAKAGNDGAITVQAGYALWTVEEPEERVAILEATGHGMVYVNGEPRPGDPYGNGALRLPVKLKTGTNELLFAAGRGGIKARLVPPRRTVAFDTADLTLPDVLENRRDPLWAALIVTNATPQPVRGLTIYALCPGGTQTPTEVPEIPPLCTRKVGFRFTPVAGSVKEQKVVVSLLRLRGAPTIQHLDSVQLTARIRKPGETYKRTFVSSIDGSVQYYAVNPAISSANSPSNGGKAGDGRPPALFLSLHGAGVEAIGQADAYSAKRWGHIVAATNRRPFGFDWEDWGRMDAMEVLADAQRTLKTDPERVYLTGHSMGGHGTWQVAAQFPDRFAAIGPSAGWISMFTYAGARRAANPDPVLALVDRAASPSDTLALIHNYTGLDVYVLHGVADDNVPISEARRMVGELSKFHHAVTFHEQPGAGHWWDASDEPGADCVDWAPMFDLFSRCALPRSVRDLEFATANPGINGWRRWAGILQQRRPLEPSSITLRCDPFQRRFSGTTANVRLLALKLEELKPGGPVKVELDGKKIEAIPWPASGTIYLMHAGDTWTIGTPPSQSDRNPARCGPFKEAFRNRMLFVYGTVGTPEENAWSLARARFDAETWRYRGNGAVDVLPDSEFDGAREKDRSVVLYGNADTNGAWKTLLSSSPIQARRGSLQVGGREEKGDEMACLFLRPRPGSDVASVAVVSGTGLPGLRLTERLPYFVSGVALPDWTVFGPEMLEKGADGIRAAGYFASDWSLDNAQSAWRTPAP